MTVLKINDIEKLYSEKVAEYIMKGYSISIEHTKGSQTNEISTICLSNDNGKTIMSESFSQMLSILYGVAIYR